MERYTDGLRNVTPKKLQYASARAGARRARQGGRGAGRVPQVRRDAPRAQGARQGRVAEVGPRVLRPYPLAQDHGPARVLQARGGRLGELRRARVRGRDARGVREGLRGVPGHVLVHAHGARRGRGPRTCAVREGTAVSCQVDGTRPGESPAGGPGRRWECPGSLSLTVEELWNVPSSCADDHYPDDFSLCGIPDLLALENRALISPVLMVFRLRSLSPTVFNL